MYDPYAKFQLVVLKNDLSLFVQHIPDVPWEAVGFVVHAAARQDEPGLQGTAHFVEHMVTEGAATPKQEVNNFFEDCGGEIYRGGTSMLTTSYRFFVPAEKETVSKALAFFAELLVDAKLENIENERKVILSEYHMSFPIKFSFDLQQETRKATCPGLWLGDMVRPLGCPDTITAITPDVLQKFYQRHYTPANMSVVAMGGMEATKLVNLLWQSPFGRIKEGVRISLDQPLHEVPRLTETRKEFSVSKHLSSKEMLNQMTTGYYQNIGIVPGVISFETMAMAYRVLSRVLMEEIRGKLRYSYDVDVNWDPFGAFHEFRVFCRGFPMNAEAEIEAIVQDSLLDLPNRSEIFERSKRQMILGKKLNDESGGGICRACMHDLEVYQKISTLQGEIERFEATTIDDLAKLVKWFSPERRRVLLQRP